MSWIDKGVPADETDGQPYLSYFNLERTYWQARHRPNLLLVHYNDLKADLAGEMARVAAFLEIDIQKSLWPELVAAAGFEAMQQAGDILLPHAGRIWEGGARRFLYKGTNHRWRDVLTAADIELYDRKLKAAVADDCGSWLTHGSLGKLP